MKHQIIMIINIHINNFFANNLISWFSTLCRCFFNMSDIIESMPSQRLYEFHRRFFLKCLWFVQSNEAQRQFAVQTLQQQQHQQIIQHQQQQHIEEVFRSIEAFDCRHCFANFVSNTKLHQHIRNHHAKRSKIFIFFIFSSSISFSVSFSISFSMTSAMRFLKKFFVASFFLFFRRNLQQSLFHERLLQTSYILRRELLVWSITSRNSFFRRSLLQFLQQYSFRRLHILVWSITLRNLFSLRRQHHISLWKIFTACFIRNSDFQVVLLWLHIYLLLRFSTCFHVKRESLYTSSQLIITRLRRHERLAQWESMLIRDLKINRSESVIWQLSTFTHQLSFLSIVSAITSVSDHIVRYSSIAKIVWKSHNIAVFIEWCKMLSMTTKTSSFFFCCEHIVTI